MIVHIVRFVSALPLVSYRFIVLLGTFFLGYSSVRPMLATSKDHFFFNFNDTEQPERYPAMLCRLYGHDKSHRIFLWEGNLHD